MREIIPGIGHSNMELFCCLIFFLFFFYQIEKNLKICGIEKNISEFAMKMSCTSFKNSIWAFQRSLMILKLQVIKRKNMDPNSGKVVEEIICFLCHTSTLSVWRSLPKISREAGKTSCIRLRFFSWFWVVVWVWGCLFFSFLVNFWRKIIAECLEDCFLVMVHNCSGFS